MPKAFSSVSARKVYIVHAVVGEYDDREDWNVVAYTTEKEAIKHIDAAQKTAKKMKAFYAKGAFQDLSKAERLMNSPYDPHFTAYDRLPDYSVATLSLRRTFKPVPTPAVAREKKETTKNVKAVK